MSDESDSSLSIEVEREDRPESGEYSLRKIRIRRRDEQKPNSISYQEGYSFPFNSLGDSIAFVPVYHEGMHDELTVDTVVEIDGGPVINRPLFLTHSSKSMVLTGKPGEDEYFRQEGMSWESISASSGRNVRSIQTGFMPRQEVTYTMGQTPDRKNVRLKITDMRPRIPVGIPSPEPLSRA